MRLREWPGRVIPATPEETDTAIKALFVHAGWNEPITDDVVRELQKWFDGDWCIDAILVALDRKPDNTPQPRRGGRDDDLTKYLRARLAAWFNNRDDAGSATVRLPPPRPGMSMGTWWRINQRNRYTNQSRRRQTLGSDGEQARQRAREFASRGHRDPLARNRESDARLRAAMAGLLPPGAPADSDPLIELGDTPIHPRHRLVAGYAGRRSVVDHDPTISEILTRLTQQRRRPTAAELTILRSALRGARTTASLAELEALTADTAGEILSAEALQILRYYDHALADDLSLDSMVAMLTAMVDDDEHSTPTSASGRTSSNSAPQHWRTGVLSRGAFGGAFWGTNGES